MKQSTEVIVETWNTDSAAYDMLANFIVKRFVVKVDEEADETVKAV